MARKDNAYRGRSKSEVLAELNAMHAAGDISSEELKRAREQVLLGDAPPQVVKERVVEVERKKKGGCGGAFLGLVVILAIFGIIGSQSKTGSGNASSGSSVAAVEDPAKAEERRKGFHCLSAWDGSERQVVDAVKANMREPSSFEHIETRIAPVEDGQHSLVMSYRGRNGFGGMNVETAIAVISSANCSVVSLLTE